MVLPEADERISHGEPTWFAGKGKVFAMLDDHHHGAKHLAVWLPQPEGGQATLLASDPRRFFRPPYVGPYGWIGVVLDNQADWKMVARLVGIACARGDEEVDQEIGGGVGVARVAVHEAEAKGEAVIPAGGDPEGEASSFGNERRPCAN